MNECCTPQMPFTSSLQNEEKEKKYLGLKFLLSKLNDIHTYDSHDIINKMSNFLRNQENGSVDLDFTYLKGIAIDLQDANDKHDNQIYFVRSIVRDMINEKN